MLGGEILHDHAGLSLTSANLNSNLPEQYARLYDYKTGKFETPLDSQGIANIDALFELAIRTYPDVLPCFKSSERNIHHVYWTEQWWKDYAAQHESPDKETIYNFRNSTPQLAYVPKAIHAWIEKIMIPPPPPPLEVMRRRNLAWSIANRLLNSALMLDKAREDYDKKKDDTRIVLGDIPGITPLSRKSDITPEERVNREYWLSELNGRLTGWRFIADRALDIPIEDRIVIEPRLVSVRALKQRISRSGAIIPKIPTDLVAA